MFLLLSRYMLKFCGFIVITSVNFGLIDWITYVYHSLWLPIVFGYMMENYGE